MPIIPQEIKILSCTHPEIKIFYFHKIQNFPKITSKKNSTSVPPTDKIMKPWQMIVDMCPCIPSRNKNFILQWSRVKNFLLSKNPKFPKNLK